MGQGTVSNGTDRGVHAEEPGHPSGPPCILLSSLQAPGRGNKNALGQKQREGRRQRERTSRTSVPLGSDGAEGRGGQGDGRQGRGGGAAGTGAGPRGAGPRGREQSRVGQGDGGQGPGGQDRGDGSRGSTKASVRGGPRRRGKEGRKQVRDQRREDKLSAKERKTGRAEKVTGEIPWFLPQMRLRQSAFSTAKVVQHLCHCVYQVKRHLYLGRVESCSEGHATSEVLQGERCQNTGGHQAPSGDAAGGQDGVMRFVYFTTLSKPSNCASASHSPAREYALCALKLNNVLRGWTPLHFQCYVR